MTAFEKKGVWSMAASVVASRPVRSAFAPHIVRRPPLAIRPPSELHHVDERYQVGMVGRLSSSWLLAPRKHFSE
jgi:hypothetical protein